MGEARAEISFCILLFIPANIVVPCQHYVRAEKLGGGREGGDIQAKNWYSDRGG